jgi:uncharacterized protein with HEPN domain
MRDDRVRLEDMLEAMRRVQRYAALGRDRFEVDELIQVYFVHQLVILGEAASRLAPSFRDQHPDLPWRQMMGMRNVLVHGYFTVDLEAVWGVIERDLPPLSAELERILAAEIPD